MASFEAVALENGEGNKTIVMCQDCGTVLDESPSIPDVQRRPCPTCGSANRDVSQDFREVLTVRESLEGKARHPDQKKPFLDTRSGADMFRKTGKWNDLSRTINRDCDRYRKRIVDPETGKVIMDVDEPLSEHVDHGSAKKKDKKKR